MSGRDDAVRLALLIAHEMAHVRRDLHAMHGELETRRRRRREHAPLR